MIRNFITVLTKMWMEGGGGGGGGVGRGEENKPQTFLSESLSILVIEYSFCSPFRQECNDSMLL